MSKVKKLSISLPQDLWAFADAVAAADNHFNISRVLSDAVRLMKQMRGKEISRKRRTVRKQQINSRRTEREAALV